MRYDFQLIFLFIAIGLVTKKLGWRGWYLLAPAGSTNAARIATAVGVLRSHQAQPLLAAGAS